MADDFDAPLPDFEEYSYPAGSVPTLDELVSGITDENKHGEFDTGPAVGNEEW
jgi:antitoxin component of MazEF toxin-antitoxin module